MRRIVSISDYGSLRTVEAEHELGKRKLVLVCETLSTMRTFVRIVETLQTVSYSTSGTAMESSGQMVCLYR